MVQIFQALHLFWQAFRFSSISLIKGGATTAELSKARSEQDFSSARAGLLATASHSPLLGSQFSLFVRRQGPAGSPEDTYPLLGRVWCC